MACHGKFPFWNSFLKLREFASQHNDALVWYDRNKLGNSLTGGKRIAQRRHYKLKKKNFVLAHSTETFFDWKSFKGKKCCSRLAYIGNCCVATIGQPSGKLGSFLVIYVLLLGDHFWNTLGPLIGEYRLDICQKKCRDRSFSGKTIMSKQIPQFTEI